MREEREVACDDLVLRSGLAASDYAEELLRVATGHQTPLFAGRAAIAMARPGTLERRLRAILDARRDRRVAGKVMLGVAAAFCALVLPPLAMVRAGEMESVPVEEEVAESVDTPSQDSGSPAADPAELRLRVLVSRAAGVPAESCSLTFWRAREADGEAALPWEEDGMTGWREGLTGPFWEPIEHLSAGHQTTILAPGPGTYRVTAYDGRRQPWLLGDSGPIELDGSSPLTFVPVVFEDGPRHTIEVFDARTREPLEGAQIFVVRADGLPIAPWRNGWGISTVDRNFHHFDDLAPGKYTLNARIRAQRYGLPDYRLDGGPRKLEIRAGGPTRTLLFLREIVYDGFESARRWPWSVHGTVGDAEGNPLANVEVSVHCGNGTLLLRGRTRTDQEGRYTLRFDPGMRTLDEETGEWVAALQAATISPRLYGWYERDLHRGGDLLVAQERPDAENARGGDPDRVVLPDQPYRLDFVMRPAARIVGHLVDERGTTIEGVSLSLGAEELWPSSSVLHTTKSDFNGHFTFGPVPLGIELWFEEGGRKSTVFGLTEAGEKRVRVQRTADGGLDAALVPLNPGALPPQPHHPDRSSGWEGWFQVVDYETGDPVEGVTLEWGDVDDRDSMFMVGGRRIHEGKAIEGSVLVVTSGGGLLRFRVVAEGYRPEDVILTAPAGSLEEPSVLRLRRRELAGGQVVDHDGRPVAGAKVYFTAKAPLYITNGETQGPGEAHQVTDAEGRFTVDGTGAETWDSIVVLAPHLHACLVPSFPEGHVAKTVYHLPEPATLVLRYDIPGDLDEAEIRAQLATWDMPEWRGKVECTQRVSVGQGGEVVLTNLMPGSYDISRDKTLRTSRDLAHGEMCDRQTLVLGPGERQIVEFVRKRGARVSGRVLGLEKTDRWKAIVTIREASATGEPMGEDWKKTTFDGQVAAEDGKFETALLEPGEYLAVAHVYRPLTEEERYRTGWILPSLIGTTRFVIPSEGDPEPLEIEIVKFTPK